MNGVFTRVRTNTFVVGETYCERRCSNFLDKQVFLVQEEDDGRVCEPLVVADRIKQLHAFLHTILKIIHTQTILTTIFQVNWPTGVSQSPS